ncbi:MAG: hypothetical protein QXI49_04255 [Candidatus Methanomethylicaceae archaeon]
MISSSEDLAKFIYCCGIFEERVAKAYEHMSKLIEDATIACFLAFIAHESFKHADCLRRISKLIYGDLKIDHKECEGILGEVFKSIMIDIEKVLNMECISHHDLASVIEGLERIEGFAAEEYLTILQIRLVELMAESLKLNINYLKTLLEWIVEDEKRHESILKIIKNFL